MTESELLQVYDLFYPSPPALAELASIKTALQVCRREIVEHRTKQQLKNMDLKYIFGFKSLFPDAKSDIIDSIGKFVKKIGPSIESWLNHHFKKDGLAKFEILNHFDDFVCDFDGKIHYRRTAERIVLCDEIRADVRFEIACKSCLEDAISKLWPSTSSRMSLKEVKMADRPETYYWICRLTNKLDQIRPRSGSSTGTAEEIILDQINDVWSSTPNWPSVEYFLNRLNPSTRAKRIKGMLQMYKSHDVFRRYLLPKLNVAELRELYAADDACDSLIMPMLESEREVRCIVATWSRIKYVTSEEGFSTLIGNILKAEANAERCVFKQTPGNVKACCEIWTSAPDHLKRAAFKSIDSDSLEEEEKLVTTLMVNEAPILLTILSDPIIEDKDKEEFFKYCWGELIINKVWADLNRIIDLCFKNKDHFQQFKTEIVNEYHKIIYYCVKIFQEACFEYLNAYLVLFCPNENAVRVGKRKILEYEFDLTHDLIEDARSFRDFVDSAYGSEVDLANKYKIKIWRRAVKLGLIKELVTKCKFKPLREFADNFFVAERELADYKKRVIVPLVRNFFNKGSFHDCGEKDGSGLAEFMSWLLGSDEEIARFKQTIQIDGVAENQSKVEKKLERQNGIGMYWSFFFLEFLKWYFVTEEALGEFTGKFTDDRSLYYLLTMAYVMSKCPPLF